MQRSVQDSIEEICKLRSLVSREVYDHKHTTDCVCGRGGFWGEDGWPEPLHSFRDSGDVNRFIRAAVVEKIAEVKRNRRRKSVIVRRLP